MKLTNEDAWHCFAGGCFAAADKNAWQAKTTIGDYSIQPISSNTNCERHIGYQVHFLNVLGKCGSGLWQPLKQGLCNLREARRLCQTHLVENKGEIEVPSELAAA